MALLTPINTDSTVMRLAVLRLCAIDKLTAKEPSEPCVFVIQPSDPLTDAQLRLLVTASPWRPVMVEATLGRWDHEANAFEADITTIETMPAIPLMPKARRKCEVKKQHNRMLELK